MECTNERDNRWRTAVAVVLSLLGFIAGRLPAQDIPIGATFICNGEHIYVENCNIRDTSDTSTCMVAHPDHLSPTGMNTYTYMTRGALKKLLPTCTQPTPQQLAAQAAFEKKQQALIDAQTPKYNTPPPQSASASAQSGGASYGAI